MFDFDIVDLPDHDAPAVGDTAPDFTRPLVNDEYWENASLSDVTDDGPVLLVFHTMDGAFPSTYIWNNLRDRDVPEAVQAVGVSISSPYEHKTFLKEREVDARFFSDPAAGIATEYGIENDLDGMAGITEHRPALFLLDEERTVQYAWVADQWPDFPDYDEVADAVSDL
ncbi:redoxin domain-containing protein [Haloferax mediterranei ATCC 33500]|uniref:AhpC/TSA family protein n=1 Tax=Haloferax mediterranei (strain ATCC 33500 / DSM 1411 / JCM 8866 / NBRC 14739 / NCIMB 2177 / R-4) TaxID=523841 RepID=I3R188_HALMT|nr:redoxin domain-containing protein [Haloferax mediterranei]AFK17998.1 peroxiredoxin-like protein [Haloferax mediterranei ATCC 33500]AHZ22583.1 AhpC/TSA family protein [Haloferax mediterranei ATCC 33500]EMA02726.1 peroxiredoxin-like protein [Haloferax mediterranei ATCC 33500]MDX5988090.1 redoxin domain-containing protein [Haloferax mediterranei ATCC 33500]QCQ74543.1 redoxin domain-containing protein [Haloferax mediterranei ATCC 33500]